MARPQAAETWTMEYPDLGADVDIEALLADLRRTVDGEIRFDDGSRALYATDASNYRQVPIGVVIPCTIADLAEAVRVCGAHGAPILNRGCGTSLAGQCANTAVVIDGSKYCDAVLEIDPERRRARVEPGVILDTLRRAAERHGLTFGPDPATHGQCTIGGMIGNNSGGVHSVTTGLTVDNVEELDILTGDGLRLTVGPTPADELDRIIAAGGRRGAIYRALRDLRDRYADEIRTRFPDIPRRVSGYGLDWLLPEKGFNVARALVGSEGTCVTVLGATLRLVPDPPAKVLVALGFDDICVAADHVPRLLEFGPIGLEGIDHRLISNMRKQHLHEADLEVLPGGDNWLLAQFGGDASDEAEAKARALVEAFRQDPHHQGARIYRDASDRNRLWRVREAGLAGTAWVPGQERDTWPGWEDSAVAREDLGDYLRDLYALYDRYGYHGAMYGHFGDGLVHTRIDFGLHEPDAVARFRRFMQDAAELVHRYGGSLSGEHGDGQARSELLPVMYGREIVEAFTAFKAIWDPQDRMNPGKLVRPRPLDVDLRLGPRYDPPTLRTHFSYADSGGSFSRAALRCVGVGKCRRLEGGTMCPSFRAVREEKHTTRGRARVLQEMLQGDPLTELWRSEPVREALDLCLACKGCKSDCPVNVDVATYKAEFLAHYYAGRLRPRAAYSMGLIHVWARLADVAPWLPNLLTQTRGLDRVAKAVAGIAPQRSVPAFAGRSFRRAHRRQAAADAAADRGRPTVLLWTDTFNNHFTPRPLHAAAAVLRAAGYRVAIPRRDLCCGRPLYEFGMLDRARSRLRQTLDGLRDWLERDVWIVGVEPSCIAVFKDELVNLLPDDPAARRLSERAVLFSEFLERVDFAPPRIDRSAIVHGHCHHKALWGMGSDKTVLERTGMEFDMLDSGCCGMAGGFGYEPDKYEVSLAIAEQTLLPLVRRTDPDTLVIADGFSCRTQIAQGTGRRALTLPEVLRDGLRQPAEA